MSSKSKRLQWKENQKECPKDAEKEIAELKQRHQVQEVPAGVLKKEKKEWEEKYNTKRDAEARRRAELQRLEKTVASQAAMEITLSQKLETVVKDTLVLIIAAVVMKAVYKRAAEVPQQDQNAGGLRNLRSRLLHISYENAEQVVEFADMKHSALTPTLNPPQHLQQSALHQDDGGDHFYNELGFRGGEWGSCHEYPYRPSLVLLSLNPEISELTNIVDFKRFSGAGVGLGSLQDPGWMRGAELTKQYAV
ncbi:hypothetical protein L873DRAFT_1789062 [Choiromyces venosus 120613-1]|uniref:Uncharacterized protein n=1 Tax=Choiromyces venosus 120613-1 TaxID=1336337 RepID=A0A3N4JPS6_9PEZI|nr:hypothetical protein L873DRAFT_1789062 [Choiromyces venosus 120613-1]